MKVLFLDFDGVLGPTLFDPYIRQGLYPDGAHLNEVKAQNWDRAGHLQAQDCIRHVIDVTGCKVVLSTAWRAGDNTDELAQLLLDTEVIPSLDTVIGATPEVMDGFARGTEIRAWLELHFAWQTSETIESWAIVDDHSYATKVLVADGDSGKDYKGRLIYHDTVIDAELKSRFVQTNSGKGCTQEDADRLIKLLGRV